MIQETSIKSFKEIKENLGERQAHVLKGINDLGCPTDMELSKYLRLDARSVGPRRNELVKLGLVTQVEKRMCVVTHKTAFTWRSVVI